MVVSIWGFVELVFDFLFSLHDDPTLIAHFRTSIWNFGSTTMYLVLLTIRVFQSLENNEYWILNNNLLLGPWLARFLSLENIRMNQIRMSKVIIDQKYKKMHELRN